MKPTALWLGCLALAGTCLVGCGGGDVPDPSSDASAAAEPAPKIVDRGAAAAEAAAAPEPATAAEAPTPVPAPTPTATAAAEPAPTPAADPVKPAADPAAPAVATAEAAPAAPPKGDSSGTEEMLRMAAAPTPAPAASGGDAASPTPAPNASPAPAGGPVAVGGPMPLSGPAVGGGRNSPESRALAQAAGNPPGRAGDELAAPGGQGGRPGAMAGGGPGAFGASGGPGGGPGGPDGGPEAFRNPGTAVQAFLAALKIKNKDRLSQATARRAATESVEKHRKIFAAILEQSISDEELDDMSKALEGFQVQSILPAKSTGQIGVVIGKMDNRDLLQKTVQVRKEKEGWKVMDFGATIDFKPVGTYRNPNARRR